MEMEDHHHQYQMAELRQLINGRSHFQPIPQPPPDLFSGNHHHQQFDMMMNMQPAMNFNTAALDAIEGENGSGTCNGRWPRQETLTLLEIRSRLDHKFKEANQKGPSWDEVSRIMSEEHGYQRSGKKCREKFENLYKYYKKTKESKAGRQDGKHYRFFRQLEALYGESSTTNSAHEINLIPSSTRFHSHKVNESLSLSNSSEFDTCSSNDNDNDSIVTGKKRVGRSWKGKIKEFVGCQMKKLVEKQELWLEKMMQTLEQKEKERLVREEEWRKHEVERAEREQKFWAKERAWIEARDSALMEALQKFNGKEIQNCNETPLIYREKWDKKRKEISRSSCYYENYGEINDGSSPSSSNVVVQENCFRFLMGENGDNLWENYGVNKISKEGNQ